MIEKLWLGLRSTIFMLVFTSSTIIAGLFTPLLYLIPRKYCLPILKSWTHFNVWALKVICGVKYQLKNPENLKQEGAHIVLANHQSTWETMAIPNHLPRFAWVLKKELFKIPFFGWAIKLVEPIAIDRSAGRSAIDQIKEIGTQKLQEGTWVTMFPEGTRVLPGKKARYKMGGAILASHSGFPILPIAHNAGDSWPRHSWIKKPGMITISVGEPIQTEGRDAGDIIKEVEKWIENEKTLLPPFSQKP